MLMYALLHFIATRKLKYHSHCSVARHSAHTASEHGPTEHGPTRLIQVGANVTASRKIKSLRRWMQAGPASAGQGRAGKAPTELEDWPGQLEPSQLVPAHGQLTPLIYLHWFANLLLAVDWHACHCLAAVVFSEISKLLCIMIHCHLVLT